MDRYDIDDILEEARRLKEQRRDVPAPSRPAEPAPAAPAAPAVVAERPAPGVSSPVVTGPWEEPGGGTPKKTGSLFLFQKKEKEQEWEDEWEALAAPEQPVERTEELPPFRSPWFPQGGEKPAPVPPAPAEPVQAVRPRKGRQRHPGHRAAAKGAAGQDKKARQRRGRPAHRGYGRADEAGRLRGTGRLRADGSAGARRRISRRTRRGSSRGAGARLGCGKRRPHPWRSSWSRPAGKKSRNFKRSGRRMAWISSWPETRKRTTTPPRSR